MTDHPRTGDDATDGHPESHEPADDTLAPKRFVFTGAETEAVEAILSATPPPPLGAHLVTRRDASTPVAVIEQDELDAAMRDPRIAEGNRRADAFLQNTTTHVGPRPGEHVRPPDAEPAPDASTHTTGDASS